MKFNQKYYYMKFSNSFIPLNIIQKKKLLRILEEEDYQNFLEYSDENYLILSDEGLVGFFFFSIS